MARKLLLVFVLMLVGASSAHAQSLIVEPETDGLVPSTFQYRYDATRQWVGCWHYDFLQGSGWYPATWHHTKDLQPYGAAYRADFSRSWYEWYCQATLGIYNYVDLVWTDPNDPSVSFRGVFQVHANGTSTLDSITCEVVDTTDPWNNLQCEAAVVRFAPGEVTTIRVNVDPESLSSL